MKRRRLLLFLTALASLGLTVALAEVVLRATLRIEGLDLTLLTHPELASDGWRRVFVRDYRALRGRGEMPHALGGDEHDPVIGWDVPGRIRRDEPSSPVLDDARLRVVVVGDSFTYGAEVETHESFPARLGARMPERDVLNLGVRAYGVDQAALKLWLVGMRYAPDVVVFAIFGPDYYRTPLSFYRFAKPRFVLDDRDVLRLRDVPVPTPDRAYDDTRRSLLPLWYGGSLLRAAVLRSSLWESVTHHDELFFHVQDELHEAILRRTAELVAERGARLLLVYVPQAYEFARGAPPSRERRLLTRIFRRVGVPSVDLVTELTARYGVEIARRELYLWQGDDNAGHFSPAGNDAVAEVLAEAIADLEHPPAGASGREPTSGTPAS